MPRAVRILVGFRECVVEPVSRHPRQRSRLQGERPENAQQILKPFRSRKSPVRKQAVITDPDPEAAGDPPENECGRGILPAKRKQCADGGNVKKCNDRESVPVDLADVRFCKFNYVLHKSILPLESLDAVRVRHYKQPSSSGGQQM